MPIYDYICTKCRKTTEIMEKYEEKTEMCPHCLNRGMKRLVGAGGFTFKNPAGTTQRRTQNDISE